MQKVELLNSLFSILPTLNWHKTDQLSACAMFAVKAATLCGYGLTEVLQKMAALALIIVMLQTNKTYMLIILKNLL